MSARYTMYVSDVCKIYANESDGSYTNIENILNNSWEKIFDFPFTFYDETKKADFCKKILRHFYFREIGCETVALWKFMLNRTLNEEMPYFNKLYESAELEFNPLDDYDLQITSHDDSSRNNKANSGTDSTVTNNLKDSSSVTGKTTTKNNQKHNDNGTSKNLFADTPQGSLSTLDDETYLTDARKITDSKTFTADDTQTVDNTVSDSTSRTGTVTTGVTFHNIDETKNENTHTERKHGKVGGMSYAKMLEEYRATILNIDMLVMQRLESCFMQIF